MDIYNLTINIDTNNLDSFYSKLDKLKNENEYSILIKNGVNYKILVDKTSYGASNYIFKDKTYNLLLTENSFKYLLSFIESVIKSGYANVNHIHIDFYNEDSEEITLTILLNECFVKWEDEKFR